MNYLITGGTGFIGTHLRTRLLRDGHTVTVITRSPDRYRSEAAQNQRIVGWDDLDRVISGQDVVINLAGENLFGKRWSEPVKKSLHESRIGSTRHLVDAIQSASAPPSLLVSASAIGYYGDRGTELLDETSVPGDDFLARLCVEWEAEALRGEQAGIRVALPRIGVALHGKGGMLEKLRIPFLFFVGGTVGSGSQYIPWVHLDDLCDALIHPVENENFSGPYNVCTPEPATMKQLATLIGRVMNRPSAFRVPEFLLRWVLGEAAGPVMSSIRARPVRLMQEEFEFRFEDLEEALADVL